MRRPRTASGLLVVLTAACAAAGCLGRGGDSRSAHWLDRLGGQPLAPDGLFVFTALIDQPAGDPFLNHGLWSAAHAPVSHERATLLARNGLRVGVVSGGMSPAELEPLLASEGAALDPMVRTMRPGVPKVVPVNGPLERCAFRVLPELAAEPARVEAAAVECGLAVTAEPAGGAVKLQCSWQVQHGDRQAFLQPTADGTAFARRDGKPREAFPALDWEVTLGPHDHLVVGAAADPVDTLGQAFFFAASPDRVRQRVLVIRAGRGSGGEPAGPARTVGAAAAQQTVTP